MVISQSLAKEAKDRYPSSGKLATDLLAALENRLSISQNEIRETREIPQSALLMTNMIGHVIFVDNQCLNLLKRHHNEARHIVGKPIQTVLGWSNETASELFEAIRTDGKVNEWETEITDSRGQAQPIKCSALATRDDEGTFVGADITLISLPKPQDQPASEEFNTVNKVMDTQEKSYLQSYFITQIESLYELMVNWAGPKVARYLEDIINETGRRNVWPVHMEKGRISVELKKTDLEVYQALLTRGMVYAASIIGKQQVIKEMEYVNKNTNPAVLAYVQSLGMGGLYDILLD